MRNSLMSIIAGNVFLLQAMGGTERLFRGACSAHSGHFDLNEIRAASRRNRRQNHR